MSVDPLCKAVYKWHGLCFLCVAMDTRHLGLALLNVLVGAQQPSRAVPVLTEVLARQGAHVEFIEIFNPGPNAVDLQNWIVSDGAEEDRINSTNPPYETILQPRRLAIVTGAGAPTPPGFNRRALWLTVDDRSIGNGLSIRDPVILKDPNSSEVVSILDTETATRLSPPQGVSIERVHLEADGKSSPHWAVSHLVGGTPGSINTRRAHEPLRGQGSWLWSSGDWSIGVDHWTASILEGTAGPKVPEAMVRIDGDETGGTAVSVRLGPDAEGRVLHLTVRLDSIPLGRHGPLEVIPWLGPTP